MIFCFHGYGETSSSFSFLGNRLSGTARLIAIDLPFHGSTIWKHHSFLIEDLSAIINMIMRKHSVPIQKFSLLGFSMGGRIALSFFESNPAQIDRMILLAPDGLKVNKWYWIATQTFLGNRLFSLTMKWPGWFFITMNSLSRMGMVNSSIHKFVQNYIDNPEVRDLLYKRWISMRTFRPSLDKIKQQIQSHSLQVRILYGEHDKMILPTRGKKFQKGIESFCTLQIIDSGHQVLHPKNAIQIVNLIES